MQESDRVLKLIRWFRTLSPSDGSRPDIRCLILDLTRDNDAEVRARAAQALSAGPDNPEVQAKLFELLRDTDPDVRQFAANVLQNVALENPEAKLLELAHGANPSLGPQDSDFTITFAPSLSTDQIHTALNALADYYRACGGLGLRIEFELGEVLLGAPIHVER